MGRGMGSQEVVVSGFGLIWLQFWRIGGEGLRLEIEMGSGLILLVKENRRYSMYSQSIDLSCRVHPRNTGSVQVWHGMTGTQKGHLIKEH